MYWRGQIKADPFTVRGWFHFAECQTVGAAAAFE
jgi:hypothetical protein